MQTNYFDDVTLLITHYNRSHSLVRLLSAIDDLQLSFKEIVVSDDASDSQHLDRLAGLQKNHHFTLLTTPQNRGLGNNINKGQDYVKTPYTLYLQEDFVPLPAFLQHFRNGLQIMKEEPEWDIVTFYSTIPYPYLRPHRAGFSEKVFHGAPWYSNHLKFYVYGDNPLLRRHTFFDKFGRYPERTNGDRTEIQMCLSFIKNKGKALFFDAHNTLLTHQNSDDEPSTATFRKSWRNKQSMPIKAIRWLYLKYKLLKLSAQLLLLKRTNRRQP